MPTLIIDQPPCPSEPMRWEYHAPGQPASLRRVIPLVDDFYVGRVQSLRSTYPNAGILYLPRHYINRMHCRIHRVGKEYVLEDLRSRNGTFVNGVWIVSAVLHDGDRIQLADFKLVYYIGSEMIDERDDFEQHIADHPDEDTPILAYADWLEEHGREKEAGLLRKRTHAHANG
jgi:uncharacterized protein (TIGR02996 family)